MNRCERNTLIAFGVCMTVLAVLGIGTAILVAPTVWAVAVILAAYGLIATIAMVAFANAFARCRPRN